MYIYVSSTSVNDRIFHHYAGIDIEDAVEAFHRNCYELLSQHQLVDVIWCGTTIEIPVNRDQLREIDQYVQMAISGARDIIWNSKRNKGKFDHITMVNPPVREYVRTIPQYSPQQEAWIKLKSYAEDARKALAERVTQ
jgi:hypothetical protein